MEFGTVIHSKQFSKPIFADLCSFEYKNEFYVIVCEVDGSISCLNLKSFSLFWNANLRDDSNQVFCQPLVLPQRSTIVIVASKGAVNFLSFSGEFIHTIQTSLGYLSAPILFAKPSDFLVPVNGDYVFFTSSEGGLVKLSLENYQFDVLFEFGAETFANICFVVDNKFIISGRDNCAQCYEFRKLECFEKLN